MEEIGTILVSTAGAGVMVSQDQGESWLSPQPPQGMHGGAIVRPLAQDPLCPEIVYAGSNIGVYLSEDGGARWRLLDSPMNGQWVHSLAIDPVDANTVFAATGDPSVPAVYRTKDRAKTWERLTIEIADRCQNVGIPRPLVLVVDPMDHLSVWVGIEVDGVRHSKDGGDTWTRVEGVLTNPRDPGKDIFGHNLADIHDLTISPGPPKTILVQVWDDVWASTDEGATWTAWNFCDDHVMGPGPLKTYLRGIAIKPGDPQTMFMCVNHPPTCTGRLMRSKDAGATWEELELPVEPNSIMSAITIDPAEPDLIFAASRYGYLYRSEDGGDSWTKLRREFPMINQVAWVPRKALMWAGCRNHANQN